MFILLLTVFIAGALSDSQDGGKAPRISLNDGNTIPVLGLGTFLGFDENGQKDVKEDEVKIPVKWALDAGYRLIDTAQAYYNEKQIGQAIHESTVPRENVFVVTKLAINRQRDVVGALKDSLKALNLSYVDLYLIHNPVAFTVSKFTFTSMPDEKSYDVVDYVDTWRAMEETKKLGLAKSIGISNFNISQMERLMEHCEVKPSVLQVEVNLNLAQNKIIDFCKKHEIAVMAYTPFGGLFDKTDTSPPPRVNDPTMKGLSEKYKKTVPQIVLKYLVQRGLIPIPKSITKERIESNIDVFDFELTPEEMESLSKFNKDYRTVYPSFWQDHPYYPFERKDVADANPFKKS